MPVFFQHQINECTRLAIWKIEETEDFFLSNVPLQKEVTHPHKRLQHLAGRFLLQFLYADFPYELIKIATTLKPYLPNEQYHFSISHCGDYAAAVVSSRERVGIDIEVSTNKAQRIKDKFLTDKEQRKLIRSAGKPELTTHKLQLLTLLWCCKEAVFKWYGEGSVDFRRHIQLQEIKEQDQVVSCLFSKTRQELLIRYHCIGPLVIAWTTT